MGSSDGQTIADDVAAALARHGVEQIFGQSLPSSLLLAAEARGIRQVVYRTENGAGAMADGFARLSGRVGVVAAQNGPAATLLVPPLAEAYKASVPVVALVQEVGAGQRDRNAFQELDHFALFSSCTKWVRRLDDPSRVDDYIDMALVAATSGRPGPVVLLLPKDVLAKPAEGARRRATLGRYPLDRPRPAADSVRAAADVLAKARRPLIVAGGGVHSSGATATLGEVSELTSAAVATTVMGKGTIAEDAELSAGVVGYFMGELGMAHGLRPWLIDVDVVLLVGTRTNENSTDSWGALPPGAQYIHLDLDPGEIGRNYEALRLVGDSRAGLEDLAAALSTMDLPARRAARVGLVAELAAVRDGFARRTAGIRAADSMPIRPERVMAELDLLITSDTVTVADASYSSIWVANYLRAQIAGQRFVTPRGLAGLGWGLPLALGAKVARPESPVVCVTGDGGFAHVWAELETAVRQRLPLLLVVLNNSVLGYQKHAELHQFAQATTAVELGPVDHAAIARACGATGHRVEDPADLGPLMTKAFNADCPVLLDVVTDPDAFPPITGWDGDARLPHYDTG